MQYIWPEIKPPYLCRPLTMKHQYGQISEAVLQEIKVRKN